MNDKTNQLLTIEPSRVYEVFTTPNGIVALLDQINTDALAIVPDLSTDKSRKAIASVAYKVSQTKSYLDGLGKEVTDKLKELPKTVDANRKHMRDTLDALREKVRQPLTDWEAEQVRLEEERKAKEAEILAKEEAAKLVAEIEQCHELGLLMLADFDRQREDERKASEQARIEHERKIAEQAAERSRLEAEAKAKAIQEEADRKARESIESAERAKQAAIEAAAKAEREKIAAEERHAREIEEQKAKAKADFDRAIQQESERAEAEQRRVKAEAEEKAAAESKAATNKEHQRKINLAIVAGLVENAGITETQAKEVVKAALSGKIERLTINYGV